MRHRLMILASLLYFVGCGSPAHPGFLALGDSYTIGESVSETDRWPAQLAGRLRDQKFDLANPEIIARTGWTSDDLAKAMDEVKPQSPYALVSLLIGVNDQFQGRGAEEFRPRFIALLDRAIALTGGDKSRVFVLSIPDWGATPFGQSRGPDRAQEIAQEIDAFNVVCREECSRKQIAYVDITPISREAAADPKLVAPDGLHPSALMYARWCDAALPVVQRSLARTPGK